jgi:hypothetical protein
MSNCTQPIGEIFYTDINSQLRNVNVEYYPDAKLMEWDLATIRELIPYLPLSYIMINQFIFLKQLPTIILVSEKDSNDFIIHNQLPSWTKALCRSEGIYILNNKNVLDWRPILDHELFHAAVYQMYPDPKVIPIWFNEAVAHLIGKNTSYNRNRLINHLIVDFPRIEELMMKDLVITHFEYPYDIVNSFGEFFGKSYHRNLIKLFFDCLQKERDFRAVFNRVFGRDFNSFLCKWYKYLVNGK